MNTDTARRLSCKTIKLNSFILVIVLSLLPSCKKESSDLSMFSLEQITMKLNEGYEQNVYFSVYPPIKTEWRFEGIPSYLTIIPSSGLIDHSIVEVKFIVDTNTVYQSDNIFLKAKGVHNSLIKLNVRSGE